MSVQLHWRKKRYYDTSHDTIFEMAGDKFTNRDSAKDAFPSFQFFFLPRKNHFEWRDPVKDELHKGWKHNLNCSSFAQEAASEKSSPSNRICHCISNNFCNGWVVCCCVDAASFRINDTLSRRTLSLIQCYTMCCTFFCRLAVFPLEDLLLHLNTPLSELNQPLYLTATFECL